MGKLNEMVGKKFGRLNVIKRGENDNGGNSRWYCQCDCGNPELKLVIGANLKSGVTRSCGCLQLKANNMSTNRIYRIYADMKQRCLNEKNKRYYDYGGRGIEICDEWLGEDGFTNFYKWATNNGYSDELTIDRIYVNGNYEPSNCKWATRKEQQNNTRRNRTVTINGETKTLAQWSEITGIHNTTIEYRAFEMNLKDEEILKDQSNKKHKQSGESGVYWKEKSGKWQVTVPKNGKRKYIGLFKELDEAIKAKEDYETKEDER